jgi:spore maturation protein CgeB
MSQALDIVFIGLSLSSSWGNGHATTYRALLRGLHRLHHHVLFLERDVPWYAAHRDLSQPDFCRLCTYGSVADLRVRHADAIRKADVVVIGSYVPDGVEVIDAAARLSSGSISSAVRYRGSTCISPLPAVRRSSGCTSNMGRAGQRLSTAR